MQQIVLCLLADGNGDLVPDPMIMSKWMELAVSEEPISSLTSWIPDPSTQSKPPPRRVLKTHAPARLAPWKGEVPEHGKVIIIARNPADAAVSMWHHARDVPAFGYEGDFEHFLRELYLPGNVESGCFWDWHGGWWREYGEKLDKILWVSYEDFKIDPLGVITKVAKFIDCGASPECIRRTVAVSSFSNMRNKSIASDKEKEKRGVPVKKNHIRQGLAGAWRRVFTKEQEVELMRIHQQKCAQWGLEEEAFSFQ